MPNASPRPLADGVLVTAGTDGQPHLLQSRCRTCEALAFPARSRCAACSGEDLAIEETPSAGSVYSWTTAPGSNPAHVVALVRLDNGLMVQGAVATAPEAAAIDARVRLVLSRAGEADDGAPLVSYAFEVEEGNRL